MAGVHAHVGAVADEMGHSLDGRTKPGPIVARQPYESGQHGMTAYPAGKTAGRGWNGVHGAGQLAGRGARLNAKERALNQKPGGER
jgi:hypothetical protein